MRFSIIVPYGNADKTITDCLDSVVAAADRYGQACEIICVNGGSTDGTSGIIDEYAARDGRFRPDTRWMSTDGRGGEGNRIGPGYARNIGLEMAKGDFIVFVDADDRLSAISVS